MSASSEGNRKIYNRSIDLCGRINVRRLCGKFIPTQLDSFPKRFTMLIKKKGIKFVLSFQGDSGGPLMASVNSTDSRVRFDQIGVVSWGIGCGQDGIPGIYASVRYHLPWIQQVTRKDTCRPVSPNSPN